MNNMEKNLNILIVDDTPEHIITASTILKALGHQIRVANNGYAALRFIEKQRPTLILLDIKMDGLDGFELCRILKENPKYADISVIFMTASDDEESIRKGFSLGAQDYVVKPYNASELLARVTAHLKIASQAMELTKSYQELDQFCHTVSHDLKSPLQVIRQLVAMLEDNPTDKEIMGRLIQKTEHTQTMVDRLLELSRMNLVTCQFTQIDLAHIFQSTYDELTSNIPDKQCILTMEPLPVIHGEETLLNFLAQNIISNSLKFSKNRDCIRISITCHNTDKWFVIHVADNGVGFDMEDANKLFHIFERLHSTEDFEGTGVGLTIMKRIMERHNGEISISGKTDVGATVILKFPKTK